MNIKGFLFDKDGTLMELDAYWFTLVDHVAAKTIKNTIGIFDNDIYTKMMEIAGFDKYGKVIPESPVVASTNKQIAILWKNFLRDNDFPVPKNFVDDVTEFFSKEYEHGTVIPTTPKLKNILEEIKNMGCKIGVATSDDYGSAKFCLEKLGIHNLVDDIFSADRVTKPKPSADTMELACETWGMSPENIIMVGDSENDMLFALNSGCKGIYISNKNDLPPGADRCIENLDMLLN